VRAVKVLGDAGCAHVEQEVIAMGAIRQVAAQLPSAQRGELMIG
jgi:hypothetical protein